MQVLSTESESSCLLKVPKMFLKWSPKELHLETEQAT